MEKVKFIEQSSLPERRIGAPGTKWKAHFEQMRETGEAMVLYPDDSRRAHVMRSTARSSAIQLGLKVSTQVTEEDGVLKLFVWLV